MCHDHVFIVVVDERQFGMQFNGLHAHSIGQFCQTCDGEPVTFEQPHADDSSDNGTNDGNPEEVVVRSKYVVPSVDERRKQSRTQITSLECCRMGRIRQSKMHVTYRVDRTASIACECRGNTENDQNEGEGLGHFGHHTIAALGREIRLSDPERSE